MRENNDVIVIGGGLAGLMAAAAAAERGKKVLLLSKGTGMIAIGSGTIDVLAYTGEGLPHKDPLEGMKHLPASHPYRKAGEEVVRKSLEFFLEISRAEGYPYEGELNKNCWVPTAAGTLKPTCLMPKTLYPGKADGAKRIVVAGFASLKDHFPKMIVKELSNRPGYREKTFEIVTFQTGLEGGRDITVMDVARWLEKEEGQKSFIEQARRLVPPGSVILMPAVLGTKPDYELAQKLSGAIGSDMVEMLGIPPGVTGYRTRRMMTNYLRRLGVGVIENTEVTRAIVQDGRCMAVVTGNLDREREYSAQSYILATGGFLGGGLQSGPQWLKESIFDLPVQAPGEQIDWGKADLFGSVQPFAMMGLGVGDDLRPTDADGKVALTNVYVAGANLAGYDYCFEKSGNGVAIVSGYWAGRSV